MLRVSDEKFDPRKEPKASENKHGHLMSLCTTRRPHTKLSENEVGGATMGKEEEQKRPLHRWWL